MMLYHLRLWLFSGILFSAACQTRQTQEEFGQAQAALLAASIKADSAGMVQARQRFERLLQNQSFARNDSLMAWTHYFAAFANWQLAFVTFNNAEGAKKIIDGALAQLDSATAKNPNLIEAYAVARRCLYWRFMLDPATGKTVWPESQAALQTARSLAPEHPLVRLEEAIDLFYKPQQAGGDQQRGLARFQDAIARCEQWSLKDGVSKKWWHATALMLLGQAYLAVEKPEEAEKTFHSALALQPDFNYVRSTMLPMTQLAVSKPVRDLKRADWRLLEVDAENDGRNPNWAEVKALSFFYEARTDTLWFKLDLSRLPNPDAFGINLAVDTDQNQQNGANWWGGNRAFKYDKLVTVWVIKSTDNSYRGTVGMADAKGVQLGRYANLFQNNLAFRSEAENKCLLLGFKRADLDDDGMMNLIAAVGSNAGWNDDVPDSGAVQMHLF